jgi:hypothetical protein
VYRNGRALDDDGHLMAILRFSVFRWPGWGRRPAAADWLATWCEVGGDLAPFEQDVEGYGDRPGLP